jgi:hypothetical protein
MTGQTNDGRAIRASSGDATPSGATRSPGRSGAAPRDVMPLRRSLLVLVGATAVLFGCQQDGGGMAGVEPSAATQAVAPSAGTGPKGGPSGSTAAEIEDAEQGEAGSDTTGTTDTGTTGTATTGTAGATGTTGAGTTGDASGGTTDGGTSGGGASGATN